MSGKNCALGYHEFIKHQNFEHRARFDEATVMEVNFRKTMPNFGKLNKKLFHVYSTLKTLHFGDINQRKLLFYRFLKMC